MPDNTEKNIEHCLSEMVNTLNVSAARRDDATLALRPASAALAAFREGHHDQAVVHLLLSVRYLLKIKDPAVLTELQAVLGRLTTVRGEDLT